MISTALKKVEKHLENGTSPATPPSTKKTTPSNRGRKRKAAADDDDEFVSPTKTPAQTPKRTRAKKVKYEEVASEGRITCCTRTDLGADTSIDEAEAGDAAGDYTGKSAVEAKPAAGENSATDESAIKGENAPKEELMVKEELAVKEESVKETEMA